MGGWGTRSEGRCSISSQCHPEDCPPQQNWGFLGASFGSSAPGHPTVSATMGGCSAGRQRLGEEGPPCKTKAGLGAPQSTSHPSLRPVATERYWTCRQPGGARLRSAPRSPAAALQVLPVAPVSPRWDAASLPRQPQPLPGAHLTLTFPGAPSMPAGCHSKSKSYKQNEEKSLISIYSNEPCNNANHKSCSHCYSISVSYPSPHTFTGRLASSCHAEAPSQPQGWPGRGPASCGRGGLGQGRIQPWAAGAPYSP